MKYRTIKIAIIIGVTAAAGMPALAKKPEAAGNSGTQQSSQANSASSNADHESADSRVYFNEDRRAVIRNYYSKSQKPGNCPPGLAKKNNGCQPPGQLKKWRKGQPLPHDLVYYDLPDALIKQLGRIPESEKIIQADSDLLLINIATGMIIDAYELQD